MRSGVEEEEEEEEEEDGKVRERIAGCEMNGWQGEGAGARERRWGKMEEGEEEVEGGAENVIDSG